MTKKIQFSFDERDIAMLAAMKKGGAIPTLAGVIRELIRTGHIIIQHLEQGFELQLVKGERVVTLVTPLFYFASVKTDEKKGK